MFKVAAADRCALAAQQYPSFKCVHRYGKMFCHLQIWFKGLQAESQRLLHTATPCPKQLHRRPHGLSAQSVWPRQPTMPMCTRTVLRTMTGSSRGTTPSTSTCAPTYVLIRLPNQP